jgi:Tfp pilus assembly protein PilN
MWWERWIPKSYLTKNAICGVECVVDESGTTFQYAVLSVKKNKVEIAQTGNTSDSSEILRISKKASAPIALAICGKGIIVKKIIFSENDSLELKGLLQQHLPAIQFNEFYVQFYKNAGNSGHISLCRKEQVDTLIAQFSKDKTEIVNVFIGPLICNSLSAITTTYNRLSTSIYQLELQNGFAESVQSNASIDPTPLEIDGSTINPQQTVSFAEGFGYLTRQTNVVTDNIELTVLPEQHLQKIKTRLLLTTLIIFSLLITGTNAMLFFQKFDESNAIDVELNLYESKNNQITALLESYQKKKNLIEQAGIFDNKKMSVYADKIAASLPEDILLRELYFNPEEGETEVDSLTNFTENQLIIKGNCSKSQSVNEWINVLKSQSFIKTVNLETFKYNSEGHLPNFVIKVDTQ